MNRLQGVSNLGGEAEKEKVEAAESEPALTLYSFSIENDYGSDQKPTTDLVSLEDWIKAGEIFKDKRADKRIIVGLRYLRVKLQEHHEKEEVFSGFINNLKFEVSNNRPYIEKDPKKSSDLVSELSKDLKDLRRVVEVIASKSKNLAKQDAARMFIFNSFLDPIYWPREDKDLYEKSYLIYTHPLFYNAAERYLFIQTLTNIRKVCRDAFDSLTPLGYKKDWSKSLQQLDIFQPSFSVRTDSNHSPQMVNQSKSKKGKLRFEENRFGVFEFIRNNFHHVTKGYKFAEMEDALYFNLPHAWSGMHYALARVNPEKFFTTYKKTLKEFFEDGSAAVLKSECHPFVIEYGTDEKTALARV